MSHSQSLDKRFAADLAFLLDFEGPEQTALILLRVATRIGFRAMLEECVAEFIRRRHPGRRPGLAVVAGEGGEP
jgi:hypothetical protein